MRIYRLLGLIGVAVGILWFIGLVINYGGDLLDEPEFWGLLIGLGLLLCNFVPVEKDGDDSLFFLWYEAKKEKLKKEIEEVKKKNND